LQLLNSKKISIVTKYLLNWMSHEELYSLGEKVLLELRGDTRISSYMIMHMNRAIAHNTQQHQKETKDMQAKYNKLENKHTELQNEVREIKELLHFVMINNSIA
jgi:galactokinase/mevalonate kinase-like predicted kinase